MSSFRSLAPCLRFLPPANGGVVAQIPKIWFTSKNPCRARIDLTRKLRALFLSVGLSSAGPRPSSTQAQNARLRFGKGEPPALANHHRVIFENGNLRSCWLALLSRFGPGVLRRRILNGIFLVPFDPLTKSGTQRPGVRAQLDREEPLQCLRCWRKRLTFYALQTGGQGSVVHAKTQNPKEQIITRDANTRRILSGPSGREGTRFFRAKRSRGILHVRGACESRRTAAKIRWLSGTSDGASTEAPSAVRSELSEPDTSENIRTFNDDARWLYRILISSNSHPLNACAFSMAVLRPSNETFNSNPTFAAGVGRRIASEVREDFLRLLFKSFTEKSEQYLFRRLETEEFTALIVRIFTCLRGIGTRIAEKLADKDAVVSLLRSLQSKHAKAKTSEGRENESKITFVENGLDAMAFDQQQTRRLVNHLLLPFLALGLGTKNARKVVSNLFRHCLPFNRATAITFDQLCQGLKLKTLWPVNAASAIVGSQSLAMGARSPIAVRVLVRAENMLKWVFAQNYTKWILNDCFLPILRQLFFCTFFPNGALAIARKVDVHHHMRVHWRTMGCDFRHWLPKRQSDNIDISLTHKQSQFHNPLLNQDGKGTLNPEQISADALAFAKTSAEKYTEAYAEASGTPSPEAASYRPVILVPQKVREIWRGSKRERNRGTIVRDSVAAVFRPSMYRIRTLAEIAGDLEKIQDAIRRNFAGENELDIVVSKFDLKNCFALANMRVIADALNKKGNATIYRSHALMSPLSSALETFAGELNGGTRVKRRRLDTAIGKAPRRTADRREMQASISAAKIGGLKAVLSVSESNYFVSANKKVSRRPLLPRTACRRRLSRTLSSEPDLMKSICWEGSRVIFGAEKSCHSFAPLRTIIHRLAPFLTAPTPSASTPSSLQHTPGLRQGWPASSLLSELSLKILERTLRSDSGGRRGILNQSVSPLSGDAGTSEIPTRFDCCRFVDDVLSVSVFTTPSSIANSSQSADDREKVGIEHNREKVLEKLFYTIYRSEIHKIHHFNLSTHQKAHDSTHDAHQITQQQNRTATFLGLNFRPTIAFASTPTLSTPLLLYNFRPSFDLLLRKDIYPVFARVYRRKTDSKTSWNPRVAVAPTERIKQYLRSTINWSLNELTVSRELNSPSVLRDTLRNLKRLCSLMAQTYLRKMLGRNFGRQRRFRTPTNRRMPIDRSARSGSRRMRELESFIAYLIRARSTAFLPLHPFHR